MQAPGGAGCQTHCKVPSSGWSGVKSSLLARPEVLTQGGQQLLPEVGAEAGKSEPSSLPLTAPMANSFQVTTTINLLQEISGTFALSVQDPGLACRVLTLPQHHDLMHAGKVLCGENWVLVYDALQPVPAPSSYRKVPFFRKALQDDFLSALSCHC